MPIDSLISRDSFCQFDNSVWILLFACLAGCASNNREGEVHGSLTRNGQPVAGARVTLIPDGWNGSTCAAITTNKGTFSVRALVGRYKITLFKQANGPNPVANELPMLYSHVTSTPFACTIPQLGEITLQVEGPSLKKSGN
jgi:hypothetical protein